MVVIGGVRFLMSEVTPVQGYLAHEKTPTPLGPPEDPRHRPTVGSLPGAVSHERGTPVVLFPGRCGSPRKAALFTERGTPAVNSLPSQCYWSYWSFNGQSTSALSVYRGTSLMKKRPPP
jgi:hypothetical protein